MEEEKVKYLYEVIISYTQPEFQVIHIVGENEEEVRELIKQGVPDDVTNFEFKSIRNIENTKVDLQ